MLASHRLDWEVADEGRHYNDYKSRGRFRLTDPAKRYKVHIEPGARDIEVGVDENVLGAALAAGIPLPHSCRAGRCASCKARLLSGEIAYPDGKLPPGIVAWEAARGEVLLCQARPRSNLVIETRKTPSTALPVNGIVVETDTPLPAGGRRLRLKFLGTPLIVVRPGQFIDVESATGECERVPVVAVATGTADVEVLELAAETLVRAHGPFDSPR